jgi:hypothetical protein
MGGGDPWEWKWVPPVQPSPLSAEEKSSLEAARAERVKQLDEYITVTSAWWKQFIAGDEAAAAASQKQRHDLALQLRDNYWKLDKYVRGRVWLDRVGILKEDGSVNLTPK